MSFTFGPDVRLRSRREYVAVQQRGRRVAMRTLTLLGLENTRNHDRLGIVATRRLGGAVDRNRAKRRLREIFRHTEPHRSRHGDRPGFDLVVIARSELLVAPSAQVSADFAAALTRLGRGATS